MNFISAQFVVLFPLVLLAWRLTPQRGRWAVLLAASWLFYLGGQAAAFPLLLLATGVCYLAALRIAATARPTARRGWLALALGTCLGILFLFKYLGFAASVFGISVPPLLLPVGISFYTFQNLSYVIDAYRGTLQPERHFGYYALFVAYFPQLVAGPIERPQNLLPQLHAARNPTAYLYIPLGGSRCGRVRHCRNILIVFLASGFWHGANWTFVVWGGAARHRPGARHPAARPGPAAPAAGPGADLHLCLFRLDLFPGGYGGAGAAADRRPALRLADPAAPGAAEPPVRMVL